MTADLDVETPAERRRRTRGASSKNAQGNTAQRRARRAWLVETYRADVDLLTITYPYTLAVRAELPELAGVADVHPATVEAVASAELDALLYGATFLVEPACRCYRCGRVLTARTLTVDRIVPGCEGGTYRRDNIRPACGPCNYSTGAKLARSGGRK